MSSKIKVSIGIMLAILMFIPYGYTVDPQEKSDREIRAKSVEIAAELAEISATSVYHLDNRQLRASLAPILKKNQFVYGVTITDILTGEPFLNYYRDENGQHYDEKLPSEITNLIVGEANISFHGTLIGKIKVYCRDVTNTALLPPINSDFEYKLRFLFGLFFLLFTTVYLAYKTLVSSRDSDENPLSFGTTKFAVIVSITMVIFMTLSIAGGWFIVDQNEKNIKERTKNSLYQTLNVVDLNINKVNEIRAGVHRHITSKPEFQKLLQNLMLAHFSKNTDLMNKAKSEAILFLKKYALLSGDRTRAIFNKKGDLVVATDDVFESMEMSKASNSPFMAALAGQYALMPPSDSDTSGKHVLYMVMPIFDSEENVIAVSVVGMRNERNVYTEMQIYDFSQSGEAVIVDRHGDIISKTRFEHEQTFSEQYKDHLEHNIADSIKYGQIGEHGEFGVMRDYRGKRVFTVVDWNSQYGIGYVAKIDESEVLENYYEFRRGVYIVISFMAIFSIPFTFLTLYIGKRANEKVRSSRQEIITRLGHAAEFKDNDTARHIARISLYSEVLAKKLNMSKEWCELLFDSSPMHDIGKIGVPDHILNKPGKLDADEWEVMKKHPEFGAAIIGESDSALLSMAREIALYHHEKWDGTGYPHGTSGEDIPISARIVAVADVFDALTCERVYKKAWTLEKAVGLIMEESGRHFDPMVVKAFVSCIPEFKSIQTEYADKL